MIFFRQRYNVYKIRQNRIKLDGKRPVLSNTFPWKRKFQTLPYLKMSDLLNKSGIFFDEVDKICILEPEVSKLTSDLKEECQIYAESN